uniref:Putative secreted peptide n=1 Tax=Anopheles braziliensis TaxID=58242 RepID=A0A2M3ZUN2_9DIPT
MKPLVMLAGRLSFFNAFATQPLFVPVLALPLDVVAAVDGSPLLATLTTVPLPSLFTLLIVLACAPLCSERKPSSSSISGTTTFSDTAFSSKRRRSSSLLCPLLMAFGSLTSGK